MADSEQENIPVSVNSSNSVNPASSAEPGITPPAPGAIISSGQAAPPSPPVPAEPAPAVVPPRPPQPAVDQSAPPAAPGQPPQPVTPAPRQPGGGKKWLKRLLVLFLAAALIAGGWLLYDMVLKPKPVKAPGNHNSTISQLNIGILSADYGNFYPDASVSEYNYLINAQVFEGLVRYQNKSKIAPDLATTWTNPDDKTWLFTIRPGVKFHDGHTLAAADVTSSLNNLIKANSDYAQTFAGSIASVDTVGSNQVKITTKAADPTLLNKLTFLYVIDPNLPSGDNASQAGTGPYQLKAGSAPTAASVQLTAFNQYHGGRPKTQALSFGSQDSAAQLVKAFQQHQYNIVGPIPPAQAAKVSGATKFVTTEPAVDFIGFNTVKAGPLQNKLVRQAIRYAVSPQTIGQVRGTQVTPLSQLIPQEIPGYNPAITPYKQDVAKAKQLLTQAGYPNGLTLRLSTADTPQVTDELVKELKAVGITATVDQHKDFDEFINYFDSGQADMFTVDYGSDTLDGLDIYQSTLNSANYNNPQLTALLDQAATQTDPAKRLKLLQQAATIIDQDAAVVPLSLEDNVWLMDKPYAIQQDLPSSLLSVYFCQVQLK